MKLSVRGTWIEALIKRGFDREEWQEIMRWRSPEHWVDIHAERFTELELNALREIVKECKDPVTGKPAEGVTALIQKVGMWSKLRADPVGVKIGRLEQLEAALKAYIGESPNKWLFKDEADGIPLPYFVVKIEYKPADDDHPATTTMELAASLRGSRTANSVCYHSDDLNDNVIGLLRNRGYYLETPAIVQVYTESMERYKAISGKTGAQFNAIGSGFSSGYYRYSGDCVSMEREGVPVRVIMDDESSGDDDGGNRRERNRDGLVVASFKYWGADANKRKTRDDGNDDTCVLVPVHPYVKTFDLSRHAYVRIHVNFLTEYEYDSTLINKLVLPEEKKQLVGMLVAGSSLLMEDIVKGKTGGIIVLAVGPPGTGKTLTAEVFSEQVRRPLYAVQCSQLGTDEDTLEKKLSTVLDRAARWGAILLIDEADVYIHERGDDIQQNAIVGVFLRILESYRGVLFMTSNRETIIDDAIMSRCTARIIYAYPSKPEAARIWRVLADNYGVKLTQTEIQRLIDEFEKISGRSIKNLLKLSKLLALQRQESVTVPSIKYVSQFLDLEYVKQKVNG